MSECRFRSKAVRHESADRKSARSGSGNRKRSLTISFCPIPPATDDAPRSNLILGRQELPGAFFPGK